MNYEAEEVEHCLMLPRCVYLLTGYVGDILGLLFVFIDYAPWEHYTVSTIHFIFVSLV